MFVRKVKRKCSVRGCKNTDCYSISHTREAGNTIIACKNCLDGALKAIGELKPDAKSNIPVAENSNIPPLFYHDAVKTSPDAEEVTSDHAENDDAEMGTSSASVDIKETVTEEVAETVEETVTEGVKCPKCGKEFGSENGLKAHLRYCKA